MADVALADLNAADAGLNIDPAGLGPLLAEQPVANLRRGEVWISLIFQAEHLDGHVSRSHWIAGDFCWWFAECRPYR